MTTGVRRQASGEGTPFSPTEKTPAGGFPRKAGQGYAVLKAVMDALDRRAIPAPDEKLKRIVGGQIVALLKAGHSAERIRHFAVELALSWDNAKGHQRLLGLRQAVLQDAADTEYAEHERIKAQSRVVAPSAAAAMGMPLKGFTGSRVAVDTRWSRRCSTPSCVRTALYGETTCASHA